MIRVTDDGVGIPEGDVEHVFEPFFRVDRSQSKSTDAFGPALSICKRVIEAMAGPSWVASNGQILLAKHQSTTTNSIEAEEPVRPTRSARLINNSRIHSGRISPECDRQAAGDRICLTFAR